MRARNIKPGFFLNCELSDLGFAERILFIGLWCYADREGRFEWKPKQIKATIFPYDNVEIETLLCNLMSLHFITRNDTTGYVEHFKKHQSPHPHEAKSVLPEKPQRNQCHDMSLTLHGLSVKCNADVMIEDVRIDDIRIDDSTAIVATVKPSRPRTPKLSDEDWMSAIKNNPIYSGIDIDREAGKCQAWCMTKNKQMSRQRLLNWLNNAEKPMQLAGKVIHINSRDAEREAMIQKNKESARISIERAAARGEV